MNVLEALNQKQPGGPSSAVPDKVMAAISDSMGITTEELNKTRTALQISRNELGVVTSERDRLQTTLSDISKGNDALAVEVGELRTHRETLEASLKQAQAAVSLEQSTLQAVVNEARETEQKASEAITALQVELASSKAHATGLEEQIRTMKQITPVSTPAPITQSSLPAGDLEFEVGNVVRGPDGIQGLKIKLARTN